MTDNQNSFDKWLRRVWNVGSRVEIYLPSDNEWSIADITQINNDSSFDVEYTYNNETKTKHIDNNNTTMIRPWSESATIYKYVFDALQKPAKKEEYKQEESVVETSIPSAVSVTESAIINANIDNVWNAIKSATFDFLSTVKSTNKSASDSVGNTLIINYNDGTSQTIQITEISFLTRNICYSVISSNPSVSYSSANHNIQLIEVTTGNQTYIEWNTEYSNDASLSVIRDSRFKKKEAFEDLKDYLSIKINNDFEEKKEEIGAKLLDVCVEKICDIDVDKLWNILSNFGDVSYSDMVEKCSTENEGKIRNITIKGGGGILSEKLTNVNKNEYSLSYSIIGGDALPVSNYNSVVKLVKMDKGCKIVWKSSFNAKDVSDSLAIATIKEVLESGAKAMIVYAKK
eukprot:406646_1